MEARNSYRLELRSDLTLVHGSKEIHGTVINVGLSGIMAKTNIALEPDGAYRINFQLRPEHTFLKSWSKVAWIQEHDPQTYLVGLQFDRIDSAMHRTLADYISARWIKEHLSPGTYGSI